MTPSRPAVIVVPIVARSDSTVFRAPGSSTRGRASGKRRESDSEVFALYPELLLLTVAEINGENYPRAARPAAGDMKTADIGMAALRSPISHESIEGIAATVRVRADPEIVGAVVVVSLEQAEKPLGLPFLRVVVEEKIQHSAQNGQCHEGDDHVLNGLFPAFLTSAVLVEIARHLPPLTVISVDTFYRTPQSRRW